MIQCSALLEAAVSAAFALEFWLRNTRQLQRVPERRSKNTKHRQIPQPPILRPKLQTYPSRYYRTATFLYQASTASARAAAAIERSRNKTSNCERLNTTMPASISAASAAGQYTRQPDKSQRATATSTTPKPCSRTSLGMPELRRNGGKDPTQPSGLPSALSGGYRKENATPRRNMN